jgi:hypothetical protein
LRYDFSGITLEADIYGEIHALLLDDKRYLVDNISYPEELMFSGCDDSQDDKIVGVNNTDHTDGEGRRLLDMVALQAAASGGNWCGAGTDIQNTRCPASNNPKPVADGANYDYSADLACHRHDHGFRTAKILLGFAVRLGCDIDKDLADSAPNNFAVQAIFGRYGLAQSSLWGCYDYRNIESCSWGYTRRRRWSGAIYRCSHRWGEDVISGTGRYNNVQHIYGYKDRCNGRCSDHLTFAKISGGEKC